MKFAAKLTLVGQADDELLGIAPDSASLIPLSVVDAVCISLQKVYFAPYKQTKLVLRFSVTHPEEHQGQNLEMFLRIDPKWKTPPSSSKLFKAACIAKGMRLIRGHRITKSMFVNRVFRCRLKQVGEGAAAYTKVDMVLEKLTG